MKNKKQLFIDYFLENKDKFRKQKLTAIIYRFYEVIAIVDENDNGAEYIPLKFEEKIESNDDYENFELCFIKYNKVNKKLHFKQFNNDMSINFEVYEENYDFFKPYINKILGEIK